MRRGVILQRAEVEHLRAVAEVDGEQVALGAASGEQRLAAQLANKPPGVIAAERTNCRGTYLARSVATLHCPRTVLLHREVNRLRAGIN